MNKSHDKSSAESSSKHPRSPQDTDRKGDPKNDVGEDNQHKKGKESADDYIVRGGENKH